MARDCLTGEAMIGNRWTATATRGFQHANRMENYYQHGNASLLNLCMQRQRRRTLRNCRSVLSHPWHQTRGRQTEGGPLQKKGFPRTPVAERLTQRQRRITLCCHFTTEKGKREEALRQCARGTISAEFFRGTLRLPAASRERALSRCRKGGGAASRRELCFRVQQNPR